MESIIVKLAENGGFYAHEAVKSGELKEVSIFNTSTELAAWIYKELHKPRLIEDLRMFCDLNGVDLMMTHGPNLVIASVDGLSFIHNGGTYPCEAKHIHSGEALLKLAYLLHAETLLKTETNEHINFDSRYV